MVINVIIVVFYDREDPGPGPGAGPGPGPGAKVSDALLVTVVPWAHDTITKIHRKDADVLCRVRQR